MFGGPWLPKDTRQITVNIVRRAANNGYWIDRMRPLDARAGGRKPIWSVVEIGWPLEELVAQGSRAIRPTR
jgi:hypothetical protein